MKLTNKQEKRAKELLNVFLLDREEQIDLIIAHPDPADWIDCITGAYPYERLTWTCEEFLKELKINLIH